MRLVHNADKQNRYDSHFSHYAISVVKRFAIFQIAIATCRGGDIGGGGLEPPPPHTHTHTHFQKQGG